MVALPFSLELTCTTKIDVVIPCHPKDAPMLNAVIDGIRQYGKNIRRIIVVSNKKITPKAEWLDEKLYPFTKEDIARVILGNTQSEIRSRVTQIIKQKPERVSWIYQQLLKFYAPFVIPNILPNVLVHDADTIFLRPVEFLTHDGKILFATRADEYNPLYFDHAQKLIPDFKRIAQNCSGVAHHMLFCRDIVISLFDEISKMHNVEPWIAFCKCIDASKINHSVMSEYEIYFNYVLWRYPERAQLRELSHKDFDDLSKINDFIQQFKQEGYACTSCHSYARHPQHFKKK